MGGDSLNAHLAVMRSAFSTATAAGKVPDGRCSASIASREAACNVIEQAADVKAVVFCLAPVMAGGLSMFNIKTTVGTPTAAGADAVTFLSGVKYDPTNAVTSANLVNRPDRFRMCSAGLRLSCVNSAQFNNGWFEAVRVPTDYQFESAGGVPTEWNFDDGVAYPALSFENDVIKSSRWCNHPSYVTGKLTDLYKHQFYLQPIGDRELNRTLGDSDPAKAGIDPNFDCVLIRVYSTSGGASSIKNAIHYHVIHHFEMMYDAGSEKNRYHSHCYSAPGLVAKVDASIKKDPKASILRSPNSYGVNTY